MNNNTIYKYFAIASDGVCKLDRQREGLEQMIGSEQLVATFQTDLTVGYTVFLPAEAMPTDASQARDFDFFRFCAQTR
jgi:hypothetical protein